MGVKQYNQQKDKHYDAWLNWCLPGACNLSCEYCYNSKAKKPSNVPGIDISALMRTLDKTKKIFRINFTGEGEPFLVPNIIALCVEVTKKHYISFNSNLTSKKIEEFCCTIDPQQVTSIHASLHIKELERLSLLDRFIDNYLLCKGKDFIIRAVPVGHPTLINHVDRYRKYFRKRGIEIMFNSFAGRWNGKEYPASYSEQELETFGVKYDPALEMSRTSEGKICNAGYNAAKVCTNGDIVLCSNINERIGHIYENIQFKNELIKCPAKHCSCPFRVYDTYLFKRALTETRMVESGS